MKRLIVMIFGIFIFFSMVCTEAFAYDDGFIVEKIENFAEFSYTNHDLKILQSGTYVISNKNKEEATSDRILVNADSGEVRIVLDNVNIDTSCQNKNPAIEVSGKCNTTIILKDHSINKVTSGVNFAGIQKKSMGKFKLMIKCEQHDCDHDCCEKCGKLEAMGGINGAGIGGENCQSVHNITINGGIVTAYGGINAAGIGGGNCGSCENLDVFSGCVTAYGGINAAGIGGGNCGNAKNITVYNGSIVPLKIQSTLEKNMEQKKHDDDEKVSRYVREGKICECFVSTTEKGKITAVAGSEDCAAIGGGKDGQCSKIKIGSVVLASKKNKDCKKQDIIDDREKKGQKRASGHSVATLEEKVLDAKKHKVRNVGMNSLIIAAVEAKEELKRKDDKKTKSVIVIKNSVELIVKRTKFDKDEKKVIIPLNSETAGKVERRNKVMMQMHKKLNLPILLAAEIADSSAKSFCEVPSEETSEMLMALGLLQHNCTSLTDGKRKNYDMIKKKMEFVKRQALIDAELAVGKSSDYKELVDRISKSCDISQI